MEGWWESGSQDGGAVGSTLTNAVAKRPLYRTSVSLFLEQQAVLFVFGLYLSFWLGTWDFGVWGLGVGAAPIQIEGGGTQRASLAWLGKRLGFVFKGKTSTRN